MTAEKSGQTPTTHSSQLECQATFLTPAPLLPGKSTATIPLATAIASVNSESLRYQVPDRKALPFNAVLDNGVPDIFNVDRPLNSPRPTGATHIMTDSPSTDSTVAYASSAGASTGKVSKYFRQNISTSTPSPKQQPEVIIIEDTPTPPPSASPPPPNTKTKPPISDGGNDPSKVLSSSSSSSVIKSDKPTDTRNERHKKTICLQRPRDESDRLLKSLVDNSSIHKTYTMMSGAPARCTRSKRKQAELDYELNHANIAYSIVQAAGGKAVEVKRDAAAPTTTSTATATKASQKRRKTAEKKPRQQQPAPPLQLPLNKEPRKTKAAASSSKAKSKKTMPGASKNSQRTRVNDKAPSELPIDDQNGHLIIRPNASIAERYKIMRLIGQGTFGRVVECYDRQSRQYVAVKVGRAIPKFRKACLTEIRILQKLMKSDPHNRKGCIPLRHHFEFNNHICMVFDLLGDSLYDYMKKNEYRPFPMHHIQAFGRQLLNSVSHLHNLGLIHTDLKPENILIVDHTSKNGSHIYGQKQNDSKVLCTPEICLIDFGSAIFESEHHAGTVTTRHYRAPEIILRHGWSYPCDIWSLGCIFFELMTGEALFQTHDDLEHLAMMHRALGDMPKQFIQKTTDKQAKEFFFLGRLNYPNHTTSNESRENVQEVMNLQNFMNPETEGEELFVDLVAKMLRYEPNDRISARDALKHPFFNVRYDQESGIELEDYDMQ